MSKYKNQKVIVDGLEFDSKKEARRWAILKEMERFGQISNLQRQVKYVLIPAQREPDTVGPRGGVKKGKVIERERCYIADFVYFNNTTNETVVEDVKGYRESGAYSIFSLKRALMLERHGIKIKEV